MVKICVFMLLATSMLFTSGCVFPQPYSVEDTQNILIIGIDIEDGNVKLTALLDKIEQGNEPGKEQITTQIYVSTGKTVFDAKRSMHTYSEKRASWYHLKYIIIGENTAKKDIGNMLDFLCENDENRFLHRLIITKGASASDMLIAASANNNDLLKDLDSLFMQSGSTGESSEVHLLDYAMLCEYKWNDIYIPAIEMIEGARYNSEETKNENGPEMIKLSGYALFRENQLAGYLNGHQALGLNFVLNKIKSAEITLTDMYGQPVSLEIVTSKADINTKLSGAPSASISAVVNTFMVEYYNSNDATSDAYIQYLENQQSAYVANTIASALETAKSCKSDVFGFGKALYHKYPKESEPYKKDWCEVFRSMEVSIEVKSKIQCTYSMLNAPGE